MNVEKPADPSALAPVATRRKGLFWPGTAAWVVLVIALGASAGAWRLAVKHTKLEAYKSFDEEAERIKAALVERMQIYEDVLHGAVGLFAASVTVERAEWRAYLQSVSIEERFPGIDAVGFLAHVPRAQLESFSATTRADATPGFAVQPAGPTNDLLVVKYIEPEERHRAACPSFPSSPGRLPLPSRACTRR